VKIERMSRHNLFIFYNRRTEKSLMTRNSHHRAIFISKYADPAGRRSELTPDRRRDPCCRRRRRQMEMMLHRCVPDVGLIGLLG
jgi:hypothetical protein